jgi:hypothetical protein
MSGKFVVRSDSYGECVYLRMFGRGRYGSSFGLVRSPAEATAFSSRLEAGTKAGRAGNVIMRAFNAVELDATPAATTRPISTPLGAPSLINGRWRPSRFRPLKPAPGSWRGRRANSAICSPSTATTIGGRESNEKAGFSFGKPATLRRVALRCAAAGARRRRAPRRVDGRRITQVERGV